MSHIVLLSNPVILFNAEVVSNDWNDTFQSKVSSGRRNYCFVSTILNQINLTSAFEEIKTSLLECNYIQQFELSVGIEKL